MRHLRGSLRAGAALLGLVLVIGLASRSAVAQPASVVYVKASAAGANNGTSWADAFVELRDALAWAAQNPTAGREIWVAAGTYKPAPPGGDRAATFRLLSGIGVYGGFSGTETARDQRDWRTNETVLSGDINDNDTSTGGVSSDNSHHVLSCADANEPAIIDGFTVTKSLYRGLDNQGNVIVAGCRFVSNYAYAIRNESGTLYLAQCRFAGSPISEVSNRFGDVTVVNTVFDKFAGSAAALDNYQGTAALINCTVSNSRRNGSLINTTLGTTTITNCIFWECWYLRFDGTGVTTVSHSCIEGGWDGPGNIEADPLFVSGEAGDFRLSRFSPCINAGLDAALPQGTTVDADGDGRIVDGRVDLGAFEYQNALPEAPPLLYVNVGATGANDGSSWADALVELRDALAWAGHTPGVPMEIWVAAGTYKPAAPDGSRWSSFRLVSHVAVYGGFAGTETSREQRDWRTNETLLSGDLLGNDVPGPYPSDNSFHVVVTSGTDTTARLDGITITAGSADGIGDGHTDHGGGIYNAGGHLSIANCILADNYGNRSGGAMYNLNGDPTLIDCHFINNNRPYGSVQRGGGIANHGSSPRLINCVFTDNHAGLGGAVYSAESSHPVLVNCTLIDNHAWGSETGRGGGVFCDEQSSVTMTNSIAWGNTAFTDHQQVTGSATVTHCCVEGGYDGYGNISVPPILVDFDLLNMRLHMFSPCINRGSNDAVPPGVVLDLDGNPRIFDGTVDMGAYEYPVERRSPTPVLRVNKSAVGRHDGSSWADALNELRDALLVASAYPDVVREIWVAAGAYKPALPGGDRAATFQLLSGMGVYGGFAGTETARDQRDWRTNQTVLSGDLNGDDPTYYPPYPSYDNSYTVVTAHGVNSATALDGFTISWASWGEGQVSAGLHALEGSPSVTHCTFENNKASGVRFEGCEQPRISECTFRGNMASRGAGAMCLRSNASITNCAFIDNKADNGAGIAHVEGVSMVANCVFVRNQSYQSGGGIFDQQTTPDFPSRLFVTNCSFGDNSAGAEGYSTGYGGALSSNGGIPVIANSVIWNNHSSGEFPQIHGSVEVS